jgi:hypothetical protein
VNSKAKLLKSEGVAPVKQTHKLLLASIAVMMFLVTAAFGQGDTLSAKYEGTAKLPDHLTRKLCSN